MEDLGMKETLKYVVDLREKQDVVHVLDGKTWIDTDKGNLCELEPIRYATALTVNSLTGLVDYLKSKFDAKKIIKTILVEGNEKKDLDKVESEQEELLIHIESPTKISVVSRLNADRKRENIINVAAILDKFPYKEFMDPERFNINVLSLFQRTDDSEAILACSSSIKISDEADLKDDGVSQVVTVMNGVKKGKAEVPSPAVMRPFRTFLEVLQPESQFIFRIDKDGNCALFEADGGMWKYEAVQSIKEYLEEALTDEIEEGTIKIIA